MNDKPSDGSVKGVGVVLLIDFVECFYLVFVGLGLLVVGLLLLLYFWIDREVH